MIIIVDWVKRDSPSLSYAMKKKLFRAEIIYCVDSLEEAKKVSSCVSFLLRLLFKKMKGKIHFS